MLLTELRTEEGIARYWYDKATRAEADLVVANARVADLEVFVQVGEDCLELALQLLDAKKAEMGRKLLAADWENFHLRLRIEYLEVSNGLR